MYRYVLQYIFIFVSVFLFLFFYPADVCAHTHLHVQFWLKIPSQIPVLGNSRQIPTSDSWEGSEALPPPQDPDALHIQGGNLVFWSSGVHTESTNQPKSRHAFV